MYREYLWKRTGNIKGILSNYEDVEEQLWVISDVDYSANTLARTVFYSDGTVGRPHSFPFTVNPDGSVSVKYISETAAYWTYEFLFAGNKVTGTEIFYETEERTTIKDVRKYSLTKEPTASAECTVKLFVSPMRYGTVSGGGTFALFETVTVKAKANSGYKFDGWYESGKLMSSNADFTFSTDSDLSLEARFSIISIAPRHDWVKFSHLYGEVTIGKMGADGYIEWELAELDTVIEQNDIIKCEAESGCELSMSDMNTFTMKENSEMKIDVLGEKESDVVRKVNLVIGNIWTNVKNITERGSLSVEMNQAVCGIKGTTFACEETGSTSTLTVFEGEVELTSKKTGEVAMVKAGEKCVANSSGGMSKSTFNIAQEAAKWGVPAEYLGSAPVQSGTLTAIPSKTSFEMNGKPVSVPQAYNINDNNYLQLRGIAVLLNGTKAQFNVGWDGKYAVIETGKAYSGEANYAAMQTTTNVRQSNTSFKIDGKPVTFEKAYLIDGDTNYLQLRLCPNARWRSKR